MSSSSPLRVGVVSYLNMLPLIHGMEGLGGPSHPIRVIPVPPAPMADLMDRGELDLGMLPVGTVLDRPDWDIVGHSMIGSRGTVKSVLAIGHGHPSTWKRLHPDSHSRTSNALVQVLLANVYDVRPELAEPIPLEGWTPPASPPEAEAFVLIGTRALKWRDLWRGLDASTLDLGEAWFEWTGLPFVYAVWAARRGAVIGNWMNRFEALKRQNMADLPTVVQGWPGLPEEGLTADEAVHYLTDNIRFDLDEAALTGLGRFYTEGRKLGLFHPDWDLNRVLRVD